MWGLLKNKMSYVSVEDDEFDEDLKFEGPSQSRGKTVIFKTGPLSLLLVTALLVSSVVSSWITFFNTIKHSSSQDVASVANIVSTQYSGFCQQPSVRREWRTLSEPEQYEYLRAVRCLATKPSKLDQKGTLYDDFPWVHKHTSRYSEEYHTSPFNFI